MLLLKIWVDLKSNLFLAEKMQPVKLNVHQMADCQMLPRVVHILEMCSKEWVSMIEKWWP